MLAALEAEPTPDAVLGTGASDEAVRIKTERHCHRLELLASIP